MPTITIEQHHANYLSRVARLLSAKTDRQISSREVLGALLDLAIRDEGLYDPEDPGRPLDPLRREIRALESTARTTRLEPHELLQLVSAGSLRVSRTDPE